MKLPGIKCSRALKLCLPGLLSSMFVAALAQAQVFTVTGNVQVATASSASSPRKPPGNANVVVWLTPVNQAGSKVAMPQASAKKKFTLRQKNKSFQPHLLVIPVGSEVEFPNDDPFFHNVFSLFAGKRFDLGLYESGSTRSRPFDRPGVSYLFCNIHSEMSAVVIVLETPYYATSNPAGEITIPDVPAGHYLMQVWKEGVPTDTLQTLSRPIVVSADSTSLGKLIVPNITSVPLAHKNKYGRDYENPTPPGQAAYDGH